MESTALERAGAEITGTSLRLNDPENLSWEDYEHLGNFLGALGRAYPFWIGDFLNYGEDIFGEDFAQIETLLPHSPHTLANYKSVAKHLPKSRRREGLSYSVQSEVAYLEPADRDGWLDRAVAEGWKREDMRNARRDAREIAPNVVPAATIVADLPSGPIIVCPHCGAILEEAAA